MKKIQTIYNDKTEGLECPECRSNDTVTQYTKNTWLCNNCGAQGEIE